MVSSIKNSIRVVNDSIHGDIGLTVANVTLIEEMLTSSSAKTISGQADEYPDHEDLGRHILEHQTDICKALGGVDRAKSIGALFSRLEGTDQQLSKLIHSSLDMDRLDYLLRDARASGVPYGEIDLNYLLNSIRISPKGMLGVAEKALAAAEHFLLARVFMHRVVYYHKTTYGFEEACRQLLRRVRDSGDYRDLLAGTGAEIREICGGTKLRGFSDDYVDQIIRQAVADKEPVISMLASSLIERRPPRLLVEIGGLEAKSSSYTAGAFFKQKCRDNLDGVAKKYGVHVGQFLLCGPKPIKFEERGSLFSRADAQNITPEEREELIMVFRKGSEEPTSIVDIEESVIRGLSNQVFSIQRLYFVMGNLAPDRLDELQAEVQQWASPPQ